MPLATVLDRGPSLAYGQGPTGNWQCEFKSLMAKFNPMYVKARQQTKQCWMSALLTQCLEELVESTGMAAIVQLAVRQFHFGVSGELDLLLFQGPDGLE